MVDIVDIALCVCRLLLYNNFKNGGNVTNQCQSILVFCSQGDRSCPKLSFGAFLKALAPFLKELWALVSRINV